MKTSACITNYYKKSDNLSVSITLMYETVFIMYETVYGEHLTF